jgi:hypothetical protein
MLLHENLLLARMQYNNITILLYVMHLQAMVAKFSSISTRKLSKAISVITRDKTMVATSDYDDFHKMVKRYVIAGALGSSAQV